MTHQEFMFALARVEKLANPIFDRLVIDGKITESELAGTRQGLKNVVNTLKHTASDKVEALLELYGDELTAHFRKFADETSVGSDFLAAFHDAQVMLGFFTSIMVKGRIEQVHA